MNAKFNITVNIENNNVTTSLGSEKIDEMDTSLLTAVLKIFGDVQNRVKKQVTQFYGAKEQPEGATAPLAEEEQSHEDEGSEKQ